MKGGTWIEGNDRALEILFEAPLVQQTLDRLLAGKRITGHERSLFVRNSQDLGLEGHNVEPQRHSRARKIELVGLIVLDGTSRH